MALLALPAFVDNAVAGPGGSIEEFELDTNDFRPGPLTPGPDGNMWFANSYGSNDVRFAEMEFKAEIKHVTPDGRVAGGIPVPRPLLNGITMGPEGNLWYAARSSIGKVSPSGEVEEFALPAGAKAKAIVADPGGNLWFAASMDPTPEDLVGRITPDGEITNFPLPDPSSGLTDLTVGPGGNLWFTEASNGSIGRITPAGQITEFPLPDREARPTGIAAGPDGLIWFTEQAGRKIGRIVPSGQVTEFPLPAGKSLPDRIIAGPDGRLWFTQGRNLIGRMTTGGHVTYIRPPNSQIDLVDISAGPDGNVWYAAWGEQVCNGGGLSCLLWILDKPGVVGRITPAPLSAAIRSDRSLAPGRWAALRLACTDGHAREVCRGGVRLAIHVRRRGRVVPVVLAKRRRYALASDRARWVALRLTRRGMRILRRHPRLRVRAIATSRQGTSSRRTVVLRRPAPSGRSQR